MKWFWWKWRAKPTPRRTYEIEARLKIRVDAADDVEAVVNCNQMISFITQGPYSAMYPVEREVLSCELVSEQVG